MGIDKTHGSLDKTTTVKREEEERRGEREKERQGILSPLGYKAATPVNLKLVKG